VGGVALRVIQLGRPGSPALLALCPPFASPRVLAPLRPLSSAYRLLLADAPPRSRLGDLLDASWLPERFSLLAASGAIPTALAIAEAAPGRVRALVLTGSPMHPRALGWCLNLPAVGHVAARWLGGRHLPREARLTLVHEARRGAIWPLEPHRSRVPTMVVSGGEDPLGQWQLPGAVHDCIPEAGHLPFLTHPVLFNGRVDEFLARAGTGRRPGKRWSAPNPMGR
jgi:pimeloyl-ACP methyl ester carboxylesterase